MFIYESKLADEGEGSEIECLTIKLDGDNIPVGPEDTDCIRIFKIPGEGTKVVINGEVYPAD